MEQLADRLKATLPPLPVMEENPSYMLSETDPLSFWRRLLDIMESGRTAALADPSWPEAWQQELTARLASFQSAGGFQILIPTGGSSGIPRFCIHDMETIMSAARAYVARFGESGIIHAVNVLPQHHVGGLMPVFRSAACGGKVHFADYRNAASINAAPFRLQEASISLVPTQLQRMLADPDLLPLLQEFGLILVGGAGCPRHLLETARNNQLRLSPCYGSTETAAMVTAENPDDFLHGSEGVGSALPHAQIEIAANQRISVRSPSNLRAYFPQQEGFNREPLLTSDLGSLDEQGRLHILGRADRVIITGGEKVHPEQVEAAALASDLVIDVRCEGVPDPEWGSRVVLHAILVRKLPAPDESDLLAALRQTLPAHAVPKRIFFHDTLPRSAIGKWQGNS
ncbi:MAG TPA: AMP-binding protein [Oceanipulchritudo sp.]|nr:AMP-binding protein [Oceanipulchritudo sp.]